MSLIFSGIEPLSRALDFHAQRHVVLASNVANADTPGYVPRDLRFSLVMRETVQSGNAGPARRETVESWIEPVTAPDAPAGPDGNRVRIDRQMAKIAANQVRFQAIAETVARRLALLRYAASDGTR